ncbi:hypothetical protein ONZ45_g1107 [Pleurotus djamor]|nr:hypothetical protein ONZ45_g1107 [Pleurotus djamor]
MMEDIGKVCRNPSHFYARATPILCRLVLNTTSRALLEADSFLEIVQGVRAALNGYQSLFTQNILRSAVSSRTVVLSTESLPQPGKEGFLNDLDFARIQDIVRQDTQDYSLTDGSVYQFKHTRWCDAEPGTEKTEMIQFMATELVKGLEEGRKVEHEAHHDIESFIWVLAYALARRMLNNSNLNKELSTQTKVKVSQFFASAWGSASLTAAYQAKRAQTPLSPPSGISSVLLPVPIHLLFKSLSNVMGEYFVVPDPWKPPKPTVPLSYEDVFSRLDMCILALESLS